MTTRLQPLVSEMLLGSWTNVTSLIERDNGNGIRISRKPLTWGEQVAPTTASWTFKNDSNNLYGRNPNSIYYGLLGRYTPVRHRLLTFGDDFEGRTTSNGWGNNWTPRNGTVGDFAVAAGLATQSHSAANAFHLITHDTGNVDHDITADMSWAVTNAATASDTQWVVIRFVDTSNYMGALLTLTTTGDTTLQLFRVLGGSFAFYGSPVTVGTAHVANEIWRVRVRPKGNWFSAMAWCPASDPEPTAWALGVEITDAVYATATVCGLGSRLEAGSTHGFPVVSTFYSMEANNYRFWGEIPSFSPTRDGTGRQKSVPVTASGLGQRLQTGTRTLTSALTAAMDGISQVNDIVPAAHWPGEDLAGSTQLGNIRAGGPAQISGAVTPAGYTYSGPTGSAATPVINDGGQISGVFPSGSVGTDDTGRQIFQIQFQGVIPSAMGADAIFYEIGVQDPGPDHIVKMRLQYISASTFLQLIPIDRTGAALSGVSIVMNSWEFDKPVLIGINVYNPAPGGVVSMQLGIYTTDHIGNTVGTTMASGTSTTVPTPQNWRATASSVNAGWSFGHHALYADGGVLTAANQQDNADVLDGLVGELAGTRMIRISRQVGIAFELIGDVADTQPCGAQPQGTFMSIMQTTADVDQGILRDARDLLALEYVTLAHLYNRDARAIYTHGTAAATQDLESFQVIDDDRIVRNKITARRTGGSFAIAEITTGPTSTAEPPNGIGIIPEDLAWNLASDEQTVPFAGWRALKLGWDEARYPGTSIWRQRAAIANTPALDAATLSMDMGDRYTITDPPVDLPPDNIELLTQGYDELLANFEHQITFNGTAAKPYDIMEVDGSDVRVTGDHELRSAVDTTATAWDINNLDAGVQLIADDAQDGWYWDFEGELVQVTDVTPPNMGFVGVGTASTGSSGSRTPGLPASVATGNLMLVFASTRNSGTGIPQLAANWDQMYLAGNIALYGKIYAGGGAGEMPTITFSGGAANEDTIAQSAAFSGKFTNTDKIFIRACGCLNPSAQDITCPGVPIWELPENCMALYLGWKQDDWTSVAQPGSWNELQEAVSIAGNDAAQVWGYRLFTTRPSAGSLQPPLVVTGGAAAISHGVVVILASDYQAITVVRSVNGIVKSHAAGVRPVLVPAPHIGL